MNEFQERLQELLDEYKISRLKLAKSIKISSTTINGYFNKNYYPNIKIAIKMSKYFKCSLDYLFALSDKRNNNNSNNSTFFENFKKLLKIHNIPMTRAFKEMYMSDQNYYRWQGGEFPLTTTLLEIAKTFDTSVDYLVGDMKNKVE